MNISLLLSKKYIQKSEYKKSDFQRIQEVNYDYFYPIDDAETVLLIDSWENQEAIDVHHGTPMMDTIFKLREKYNLHMKVERYISNDEIPEKDKNFIKE